MPSASTSNTLPPKPAKFTPAQSILHAEFTDPPEFKKRVYRGRRALGVRYEKLVQEYLQFRFGGLYLPSPWIKFFGDGRWRWCQPDGVLFQPARGAIVIVECKYQHTLDAWWQVRHLYQPVLEHIFPRTLWKYEACEIVKWYDPAIQFPEPVVLAHDVGLSHKHFKVHIHKP